MNVFAMVTTKASERYTEHALSSFFQYTPLTANDRFFLIDNDGTFPEVICRNYPRLTLARNKTPQSFARNVNNVIRESAKVGATVFFLNNDLIFSKGWLEPMLIKEPSIICPASNMNCPYQKGGLSCEFALDLEDYLGHEREFSQIVAEHRSKSRGYERVLSAPFFCVKIPPAVYQKLGELDESFGIGGAEDRDFCARAYLAGLSVLYAMDSYVLHFQGKSTWRGPETLEQTQERDQAYLMAFNQKWGSNLLRLMLRGDESLLEEHPDLKTDYERGNFRQIIRHLASAPPE